MKRILALVLCLVLTIGMYPFQTDAATETEKQRISNQIRDIYWMTLSETGMDSLHGYCGTMAGWELYFMGVTETAVTQNGNEMYDLLSNGDKLTQGYTAHCYPVSRYTLEEALYTVTGGGTRDVYDLMVGFQWTNTAAGSLYGHVVVIHAILDGMVYFSEGFTTPFQPEPSEPMICTIDGVLRGILADGVQVHKGMKSGDVDPRCKAEYCYTASDKALSVGGGVLEAILCLQNQRKGN